MTEEIPVCACGEPMRAANVVVGAKVIFYCTNCDTPPDKDTAGNPIQTEQDRIFNRVWDGRVPRMFSGRAATRNPKLP